MARPRTAIGSSGSTIKAHNLSAILRMLLRHGHISRVRLARLTGLSATTITNLVADLLAQGVVVEDEEGWPDEKQRRGVGRPQVALRLVPEARYAVGVHIGVGSVRVAVTDLLGRPWPVLSLDHPLEHSPEEVLTATARMVREALAQGGVEPSRVLGIGIGASGLVDPATGVNVVAPNLGWREVPIRDWFASQLGLPVRVDNNVRAMALGEALFGLGQDVYSLAFVYARVGVGAGIVVDGQLYHGGGAGAGEIGHMTILPDGGDVCRCGNRGCLETLVSEPVITRLAEQIARQETQGLLAACLREAEGPILERILAAARAGDAATRAMLEARARYMGIALANLIDILNPELIVLGGIFSQGEDLLLPPLIATIRQRAFANLGDKVRLQTSGFGQDAGVIGAAALALQAFFYQHPEGIV